MLGHQGAHRINSIGIIESPVITFRLGSDRHHQRPLPAPVRAARRQSV
jgi:hypothetical protein